MAVCKSSGPGLGLARRSPKRPLQEKEVRAGSLGGGRGLGYDWWTKRKGWHPRAGRGVVAMAIERPASSSSGQIISIHPIQLIAWRTEPQECDADRRVHLLQWQSSSSDVLVQLCKSRIDIQEGGNPHPQNEISQWCACPQSGCARVREHNSSSVFPFGITTSTTGKEAEHMLLAFTTYTLGGNKHIG